MPASHRFDLRSRESARRFVEATMLTAIYTVRGFFFELVLSLVSPFSLSSTHTHPQMLYPFSAGLFFQLGPLAQAFMVPMFFILRATYEYGTDKFISYRFGSDSTYRFTFFFLSRSYTFLFYIQFELI